MGLGLSIVKQLTTSMNGEIVVDSVEGEGTTFTLTFPIPQIYRQPKLDAEHDADSQGPIVQADEDITEVSNRADFFVEEEVEEGAEEGANASDEESERKSLSQPLQGLSRQDESVVDDVLADGEADNKEETADNSTIDDSNEAETKAPTTAFSTTGSGNIELADSQAVDPNEEPTQLPKPSGDESLSA